MRPAVLEQADRPRARVCWHSGRAHEEESVEGLGADPGEARVTGLVPATHTGTAQVHDEIRRRTSPHAAGSNREATVEFPFYKSACVSAAAAERESGTPELPGRLVDTPVAGGTWPLGVAPHGSLHARGRAQAMWKTASVASSFHHGHGAGVCAVPDGSL